MHGCAAALDATLSKFDRNFVRFCCRQRRRLRRLPPAWGLAPVEVEARSGRRRLEVGEVTEACGVRVADGVEGLGGSDDVWCVTRAVTEARRLRVAEDVEVLGGSDDAWCVACTVTEVRGVRVADGVGGLGGSDDVRCVACTDGCR